MNKTISSIIIILGIVSGINAQNQRKDSTTVYKINRTIEIPTTLGLFVGSYFGFQYLSGSDGLSESEVLKLNTKDIWKFDRFAAEQDPSKREDYHTYSDIGLNAAVALPVLLGLDKDIRKDWFDLLVLYAETHGVNNAFYIGTASMVDRTRPLVYSPGIPMEERTTGGTRNSFFSGHTSTTAAASFFAAKVYSDYHPDLGNKKYWFFGAALVPPAIVGYYRVKAMKHFPSDVIIGTGVGAAIGILVPHLHKKKKEKGFSWMPLGGEYMGFTAKYTFK